MQYAAVESKEGARAAKVTCVIEVGRKTGRKNDACTKPRQTPLACAGQRERSQSVRNWVHAVLL